ncbi:septal ring lytic transglycosylase RlpA family protein [Comamonadaceae bacterium SL12-8]|uniref:Septal ring lytic transglycosylase RlpA family protein n=1 Tax=Amphibiibacter pelophylacis TaxID=1799477 RepID=A0ACC6P302_9BURK
MNTFSRWRLGAASIALGLALAVPPALAKSAEPHRHSTPVKAKTAHSGTKARKAVPHKGHTSRKAAKKAKAKHHQTGVASWYGGRFHGRRTASGERYSKFAMTAAHKTIPFGTWVEVTALRTGRSVKVRINDRGPYVRGRVIDLSRTSARKLGVHGVARVRLSWPVAAPKS